MNERDVKLAAMINDLVNAAYQLRNNNASWGRSNSPGAFDLIQYSKDKTEDLKKKLFEALNITVS